MSTKQIFKCTLLSLLSCFFLTTSAFAAPTVLVNPSSITSTQQTNVVLSISGFSAGETVFVEQYVDVNQNDLVDPADTVIRSFHVTDGARSLTNPNIQGDEDGAANAAIVTTINYHALTDLHSAGRYLFQVTSDGLSGDATFTITPVATSQSISGTITTGSGPLPGAFVVLLDPVADTVRTSTFADDSGNYQLYAPEAGDYLVGAITNHSGYYLNTSDFQAVTLVDEGQVNGVDVELGTNGYTVTGQIFDEDDPGHGINGLMVELEGEDSSGDEIYSRTLTDEDGNFSVTVPAGDYEGMVFGASPDNGAVQKGYIAYDGGDDIPVSANVSDIVGEVKLVDTYVSGQVVDDEGTPVSGIIISAGNWSDPEEFEASAVTDENGYYTLGLVPSDNWGISVDWAEDNEVNYPYV